MVREVVEGLIRDEVVMLGDESKRMFGLKAEVGKLELNEDAPKLVSVEEYEAAPKLVSVEENEDAPKLVSVEEVLWLEDWKLSDVLVEGLVEV